MSRGKWLCSVALVLAYSGCRDFTSISQGQAPGGSASETTGASTDGGATAGGGTDHEPHAAAGEAAQGGQLGAAAGASGDESAGYVAAGGNDYPGAVGQLVGNGGEDQSGTVGNFAAGGAVGGSPDEALAGQGPSTQPDPPVFCETGPMGHPVIGITASTDIANALTAGGNPFVLFMTQPLTNVISLSWSVGINWVLWGCFDAVPRPTRVAAGNGADGNLQVYALSSKGALFARQEAWAAYDSWQSMELPVGVSAATDIAVRRTSLYLASAEGVFRRTRELDESLVVDAEWKQMLESPAKRVAAGVDADGRALVVIIDMAGHLSESAESSPGSGMFSPPQAWDYDAALVDADFGTSSSGATQVYATTVNGSLIARTLVEDTWGDWTEVANAATAHHLTSISVGSLSGQAPFLFGIGDYALPYISVNGGRAWALRL